MDRDARATRLTPDLRPEAVGAGRRIGRLLRIAAMCALACLGIAVRPAHAFRPFDGTDAHVAEPHLFELEMSPISYARMGSNRFLIAPEITLNYGTGSGFEFVLGDRRFSTVPAGTVLGQTPATGEFARRGSAVNVVISAGTCGQASGANDLIRIAKREILAGGLTLYEACFLGIPTLSLALVGHQLDTARKLEGAGACMSAGLAAQLKPSDLQPQLGQLLGDARLRQRLSAAAMNLLDGRGLKRTVDAIMDPLTARG